MDRQPLILAIAMGLTGCDDTFVRTPSFDGPSASTVLDSREMGPFEEPVGFVANSRNGRIVPIDLICISLYPFEETVASDDASDEEIIEQIDIGGPAMIRSAAKNHRFVTVVTDPSQYQQVLADMDANDGATTIETRRALANAAFARTASYDDAIKEWLVGDGDRLRIDAPIAAELRYGENPDQTAAVFSDGTGGVVADRLGQLVGVDRIVCQLDHCDGAVESW